MGLFSLSSAGKDAKGKISEIPNWMFDLFKGQAGKGADLFGDAETDRRKYEQFLNGLIEHGVGSPAEAMAIGEQIFPGLRDTITQRKERLGEIGNLFGQVPGAGQTSAELSDILGNLGKAIPSTSAAASGMTDEAFRSLQDLAGGVHSGIQNNISGVYGGLQGANEQTYRNLVDDALKTYGGLQEGSTGAYGEAREALEELRPGGEAQAARTARSFAPLMRSTQERLRSYGINPDSPEAASMLREVGASRARAMDDQMADATKSYVDRAIELGLGEQGAAERLGLGRLGDTTDLWRETSDIDRALRLGQAGDFQNELIRNQGVVGDLSLGKLGLGLDQLNTDYNRTEDYLSQLMNQSLLKRNLGLEDFNIKGDLLRELNAEDLTGLDLLNNLYQTGFAHKTADLATKSQGAQGLGNMAGNLYGTSGNLFNQAMNYGNQALSGYGDAYNTEKATSGQGWNVLGGLASGALSALTGGAAGGGGLFNQIGSTIGGLFNKPSQGTTTAYTKPNAYYGQFSPNVLGGGLF